MGAVVSDMLVGNIFSDAVCFRHNGANGRINLGHSLKDASPGVGGASLTFRFRFLKQPMSTRQFSFMLKTTRPNSQRAGPECACADEDWWAPPLEAELHFPDGPGTRRCS